MQPGGSSVIIIISLPGNISLLQSILSHYRCSARFPSDEKAVPLKTRMADVELRRRGPQVGKAQHPAVM